MWYTVTYACGHTDNVQLYGKNKDRESRLKWLETVDCPACSKKQQTEEADQYAAENELPNFTSGSEKQIDWAKKIRVDYVKKHFDMYVTDTIVSLKRDVLDDLGRLVKKTHAELSKEEKGQLFADAVLRGLARTKENYESALMDRLWDKMTSKTDAHWWIDHRFELSTELTESIVLDIYNEMFAEEAEQKKNETVTVKAKTWGTCKNGSYWLKTQGVEESTDKTVETRLAFVDDAVENEDGTLTVNRAKAEEALKNAQMIIRVSHRIYLIGNPDCLVWVK